MSQQQTANTLVAAIDASEASKRVVDVAARAAASMPGSELLFVHVVAHALGGGALGPMGFPPLLNADLERGRELLAEAITRARLLGAPAVETHLVIGDTARAIVALAHEHGADLVFVGTEAGRLERLLLGSVADHVVRHAHCSVFVVRAQAPRPQIEPLCPDCVEVRSASAGTTMWCARHAAHTHRRQAHLHYAYPPGFGAGSNFVRPE